MMKTIAVIGLVIVTFLVVKTLAAIGRAHRVTKAMRMFDNVIDALVACNATVTTRHPGYAVLTLPGGILMILSVSDVLIPVTCTSDKSVSALIPIHAIRSTNDVVRHVVHALHQLKDRGAENICDKFNESAWRTFAKRATATVS